MAIPKVMGIETEYGISGPGIPEFNPVLASSLLINTFAGALRRIRWDYEQESPLRDARGFEPVQEREPTEEDLGLANVILPNGARYYVDHAHPELSTPECADPRSIVVDGKTDTDLRLVGAGPCQGRSRAPGRNGDGRFVRCRRRVGCDGPGARLSSLPCVEPSQGFGQQCAGGRAVTHASVDSSFIHLIHTRDRHGH
jgi:hypothetical protein